MKKKELSDKVSSLTRRLDIKCIANKDFALECVKELLDKGYRGPIIIVYGKESKYRSGLEGADDNVNCHMVFYERSLLKIKK